MNGHIIIVTSKSTVTGPVSDKRWKDIVHLLVFLKVTLIIHWFYSISLAICTLDSFSFFFLFFLAPANYFICSQKWLRWGT